MFGRVTIRLGIGPHSSFLYSSVFFMYSFHESLIPLSSTITLPNTPFRQFDPVISFLLPSALPFEKFHFGAQDHSDDLRIPSVSFPLPRE